MTVYVATVAVDDDNLGTLRTRHLKKMLRVRPARVDGSFCRQSLNTCRRRVHALVTCCYHTHTHVLGFSYTEWAHWSVRRRNTHRKRRTTAIKVRMRYDNSSMLRWCDYMTLQTKPCSFFCTHQIRVCVCVCTIVREGRIRTTMTTAILVKHWCARDTQRWCRCVLNSVSRAERFHTPRILVQ